jgi:FKBP-type peptidyl-prolyl cis-trans isomerase
MKSFVLCLLLTVGSCISAFAQRDTLTSVTGLKYVRIQAGNGTMPKSGSRLTVHYTGRLTSGEVFDSTEENDAPFRFRLGKREVIPGWDQGFLLMSEGEKGVLIVPPHLAYGERGSGERPDGTYSVPPNSTLIFEVELLKVK